METRKARPYASLTRFQTRKARPYASPYPQEGREGRVGTRKTHSPAYARPHREPFRKARPPRPYASLSLTVVTAKEAMQAARP